MTGPLNSAVLDFALETGTLLFVKSTALLVIGLGAVAVLSRSPARRSTVWTLIVAALIALPMLKMIVPEQNLAIVQLRHGILQAEYGSGALRFPLAAWLMIVWAAGAILLLIRLTRDILAARALVRSSSPMQNQARISLLIRAASDISCKRIPSIRETDKLSTAALIGWQAPVILLPTSMRSWSDEEVLGVYCHELEHVRRNDWLALIAERVTAALYWPNPLVHLALRAASGAREQTADDAVFRASVGLETYAARLIAMARGTLTPVDASLLAFSTGGDIDARVRALFARRRDRGPMSARTRVVLSLAAIPFALVVGSVNPWVCIPGVNPPATQACN